MAYPIDPKQGFMRTPDRYPHDAFGVDTGGRVRPHSGFDSTPRVPAASARSVLGGRVARTGWTKYAGNYVVTDAPDGWLWLDIHLARSTVPAGTVLAPGDAFGIVGNTGGGGALGSKATIGIHLHTSRCRNWDAVNRIINGYVRARYKGETSQQWADAHGLSDPYPHIVESLKARDPLEEIIMSFSPDEKDEALRILRALDARTNAIRAEQVEEDGVAQVTQAHAAAARAAAEETRAKVTELHEGLVAPGERGYSWLDRIRSVMNTLEKRGPTA